MENEEIMGLRKAHLYPTKVPYYKDPIQLVRAQGSYVWDNEGRQYLDVIGGIVSISVGHNHPKIKEKMKAMIEENQIQHTTFLYLSQYMAVLGKKLADVAPEGLNKCYFVNSGSEANEMAVMSARVSTGEQMVVALRHGYHGGTSVPLSLCGHSTWKFPAQPQSSVAHAQAPYCYRCPYNNKNGCHLECADDVKNVIETVTHGKIAAFIAEPVMGVGGFIDPPVEYHKRVYEIIKSFGGKYISDEVQAGVGRTGKYFFAIEESGFSPDLITMAKGLGNGAPVGAVIAKDEIADSMKGKLHFNTFGGDPYQAMQASEVIDIVMNENLIENSKVMGDYLKDEFKSLQKEFPVIGDVRGRGLMLGLELVKDQKSKEPAASEAALLMELSKGEGLLIGKGGLFGNVIRIAPSLGITKTEAEELVLKLRTSFQKLK
jgi:4-aminobutyrate aminotransferase-like enzyme